MGNDFYQYLRVGYGEHERAKHICVGKNPRLRRISYNYPTKNGFKPAVLYTTGTNKQVSNTASKREKATLSKKN